eukprot:Nk52_evm22s158 gene=Nk52_evmTU22s158
MMMMDSEELEQQLENSNAMATGEEQTMMMGEDTTGLITKMEVEQGVNDENDPQFSALSAKDLAQGKVEGRRIAVPAHRFTPLKEHWMELYSPLVEHMKLQVRMNLKTRHVELKTSDFTTDTGALQRGADFVKAFMLGFEVNDALALLRLDDLYIDSFDVTDVKPLKGDHLSRAIGRVAGQNGRTKFTIENTTRTRIVVADTKIHLLGSYQNIKVAKNAICHLIMGSPPGKVYGQLRAVASRMSQRM